MGDDEPQCDSRFATEDEALEAVRKQIAAGGREAVATWFLGHEDARGRSKAIAQGGELAQLALAASSKAVA
ncbi:MAG TPA: hypothetical protein VIR57_19210 [Chloroflexota bacterium]